MDPTLRKFIQWAIFLSLLFVVIIGYFIPFSIYILSEKPLDRIISWMNYAGIGLSLLSVALAVCSFFISNESQKRFETSLFKIEALTQNIQSSQDRIESSLNTIRNIRDYTGGTDTSAWVQDKTGPNG